MAFEYPSTITARKNKNKEEKRKKEEKISNTLAPALEKKGIKGDIAANQLEDALMRTKGSDKILKDITKLKKVVDAAADDKQLTKSLEKISRDVLKGGGRAGYKSGTRGCKLAMKGKGRAYGKNS
jgi:hypothetical protein